MKKRIGLMLAGLLFTGLANADVINFDFTGRLVVADQNGSILTNDADGDGNFEPFTPIAATLSYDTVSGIGNSGLSITLAGSGFLNNPATFHNITMQNSGGNSITGQVLVDWAGNYNMSLHIEWDATGLFNAINYGLQAGDVLSGSTLYRDANGNGVEDNGEFLTDIGSALPYSDTLQYQQYPSFPLQGPAPLAATSNSLGLDNTTPFPGVRGYFDIGSGNSMHVTSVSSVPVPAALWLFSSGLLGLAGIARRNA